MSRPSWIIIILTILIVAAIGIFYIWPMANSSWKIYQETNQAKKDLDTFTKRKEVLTELSKNNQLTNLYDIASKYIPEEAQSGELVIELTAMATQANMKVEQVSLEKTKESSQTKEEDTTATDKSTTQSSSTQTSSSTGNGQEVDFSIKISGTFADFLTFLQSTETSSRLISITAMNLTQINNQFTAQLAGKAYWEKETSLEKSLANIGVTEETIAKFTNLKTYGTPINLPTESGFGRPDPFAGF